MSATLRPNRASASVAEPELQRQDIGSSLGLWNACGGRSWRWRWWWRLLAASARRNAAGSGPKGEGRGECLCGWRDAVKRGVIIRFYVVCAGPGIWRDSQLEKHRSITLGHQFGHRRHRNRYLSARVSL